ncbi:MAG: type III secretion system chaperone [Desulfovibrionaceae bacterium]|nr:type III secretion system chaperone [Desulfovibrionaceae bacterium]
MNFHKVINDFTQKIGLGQAVFDEDGSITLLFDDAHAITFTPDSEDNAVLLHCELCEADNLDREACMKLLKASLLGASTGGAAFGLHSALDKIVLWKRHDDSFEDCQALEKSVNAFITQIIFWRDQLNTATVYKNSVQPKSGLSDMFLGIRA